MDQGAPSHSLERGRQGLAQDAFVTCEKMDRHGYVCMCGTCVYIVDVWPICPQEPTAVEGKLLEAAAKNTQMFVVMPISQRELEGFTLSLPASHDLAPESAWLSTGGFWTTLIESSWDAPMVALWTRKNTAIHQVNARPKIFHMKNTCKLCYQGWIAIGYLATRSEQCASWMPWVAAKCPHSCLMERLYTSNGKGYSQHPDW